MNLSRVYGVSSIYQLLLCRPILILTKILLHVLNIDIRICHYILIWHYYAFE